MTTESVQPEIGRIFNIKIEGGEIIETKCITWDSENRVFEATKVQGFIEMDWMEYLDQVGLGRIEMVGLPV
jgi:hypothetical protein